MRRALLALVVLVGCGKPSGNTPPPDGEEPDAPVPPDAPMAPVFRNPVSLPDDQLALEALKLIGANVSGAYQTCQSCHGMTRQHVNYWRALSDTSMSTCLTDLQVTSQQSAQKMIDCLRTMPALPDSDFSTKKLGIYATAASLPWFAYTFHMAYGDEGDAKLADFKQKAGMPRDKPPFTQEQFDIVAEWFSRGLPRLDQTLPLDPPPTTCDASISAEVAAHVTAMHTTGWRAVNKTNLMAMFGCGAETDPKLCLQSVPVGSAQPYGTGWDVAGRGQLRVLADVAYHTSYWTRSSPDGRFMAHGVQNVPGSYVYDLQRNVTVPIDVLYDPGFFPDGSGFVFQGGPRNVCASSVLTSNPASIAMTEPGCSKLSSIGLYQHVARALDNGDFFAIDSEFVSDDGGHEATLSDPDAQFGKNGYASFTPMLFDGAKYVAKPHVEVNTPYEGDIVLSPSAKVMISRVAGPSAQIGFVLRKVNATLSGSSYSITAPEIARYCLSGGKPNFSFDERWIAFHHYVTAADAHELGFASSADPGFQAYLTQGAANIYLMELTTGTAVRVTNMAPGQYALFPHFRSDGWIYADVRDTNTGREYMVASDAALLAE